MGTTNPSATNSASVRRTVVCLRGFNVCTLTNPALTHPWCSVLFCSVLPRFAVCTLTNPALTHPWCSVLFCSVLFFLGLQSRITGLGVIWITTIRRRRQSLKVCWVTVHQISNTWRTYLETQPYIFIRHFMLLQTNTTFPEALLEIKSKLTPKTREWCVCVYISACSNHIAIVFWTLLRGATGDKKQADAQDTWVVCLCIYFCM
jgi:hypothetical protein